MIPLGVRIYGLGAVALGVVGILWGDFALQWQPVAAGFPGRTVLACLFATLLVIGGVTANWRVPSAAIGVATLAALYALVVVLMHGPQVIQHPGALATWNGVAEQLVLVVGGMVAFMRISAGGPIPAPLLRASVIAMAACLFTFGVAHFVYLDFTASMVPAWIPGGQKFWAALTGTAHIAAGMALLSGIRARLALILLTIMFASFSVLVHLPMLLADTHSHLGWVINAINLALTGAAGTVAGALPQTNTHSGKETEVGVMQSPYAIDTRGSSQSLNEPAGSRK